MSIAGACTRTLALTLLAACSPELNWRDVSVPEMRLGAQFPCKPQRHVQETVGLVHCEAGGARFVLGWRPASPGSADLTLGRIALGQLEQRMKARAQRLSPVSADRSSADALTDGGYFMRAADGSSAWVRLWVRGVVMNQALVVGVDSAKHREAAEAFLASLRVAE